MFFTDLFVNYNVTRYSISDITKPVIFAAWPIPKPEVHLEPDLIVLYHAAVTESHCMKPSNSLYHVSRTLLYLFCL